MLSAVSLVGCPRPPARLATFWCVNTLLTPSTVRPWARGFCPHGRPGPLGFGLCGRLPRHGVGGFMFNSSSSATFRCVCLRKTQPPRLGPGGRFRTPRTGAEPSRAGSSLVGRCTKAPAVEFFAWLPVGVNSSKPARGSVSLIEAGFQVGLFFGRSILARKWLAKMTQTRQNENGTLKPWRIVTIRN